MKKKKKVEKGFTVSLETELISYLEYLSSEVKRPVGSIFRLFVLKDFIEKKGTTFKGTLTSKDLENIEKLKKAISSYGQKSFDFKKT